MEERAEARHALAFHRAIRRTVPACLSSAPANQTTSDDLEKEWLSKANGEPAQSAARAVQSKNVAPRAVRTSPNAAKKPKIKRTVNTPAP